MRRRPVRRRPPVPSFFSLRVDPRGRGPPRHDETFPRRRRKQLSSSPQELKGFDLSNLRQEDELTSLAHLIRTAYYVAFGPHGPREPILPAGSGIKTFGGVAVSILAALVMFAGVRSLGAFVIISTLGRDGRLTLRCVWFWDNLGSPAPRTLTKEWQEASNEKAIEQKSDPFSVSPARIRFPLLPVPLSPRIPYIVVEPARDRS